MDIEHLKVKYGIVQNDAPRVRTPEEKLARVDKLLRKEGHTNTPNGERLTRYAKALTREELGVYEVPIVVRGIEAVGPDAAKSIAKRMIPTSLYRGNRAYYLTAKIGSVKLVRKVYKKET